MDLKEYTEVISACRFCFMCRHLSAVGEASGREADTPRGRALIAGMILRDPACMADPDFVDAFYRSDLSGANRFHCDGYHDGKGYDEIGMQLAVRRAIVAAGRAPEIVRALAAELKQSAAWRCSGQGEVLYFVDPATARRESTVQAVEKVLKHAGIAHGVMRGGCIGKALAVLGFTGDAKEVMQKFAAAVKRSGAKTVMFSSPAAVDAVRNDFKVLGVEFPAEAVYTAQFFVELAEKNKVKFAAKTGKVAYLQSDYLKNYLKCDCADRLLKLMKAEDIGFGTNAEESCTVAEGALVLDRIHPELSIALARRVAALADRDRLTVAASVHTAEALRAAGCETVTLDELAGDSLC